VGQAARRHADAAAGTNEVTLLKSERDMRTSDYADPYIRHRWPYISKPLALHCRHPQACRANAEYLPHISQSCHAPRHDARTYVRNDEKRTRSRMVWAALFT
jgi:hypothetical protein